jgi:hypothetical protein
MDDPDPIRPPLAPPPWLRPDIHAAMQAAYDRETAAGRDRTAAGAAACAVMLARLAAQDPSLVEEEVPGIEAAIHSDDVAPPCGAPHRLDETDVADLVAALAYALRYDARGRPRKGGWDHAADLAAEWLAEHLRRSNFVVLRRRPAPPHRAG